MTTTYAVLFVLLLLLAGVCWVNRPQVVVVHSASRPNQFDDSVFQHDSFEVLLRTYVDESGNVDYERWQQSPESADALNSYLAAIARHSPENAPQRFPKSSDELAYWIHAYNAYVIYSILQRWPIKSVTDIKAPLEIVKGFGFFYRQRFVFGGEAYSLMVVENKKIRAKFRDPRIHFVLNCGSESCPPMRPALPTGDRLEVLLQDAALDFIANPANVTVDHEKQEVRVSKIFKWYRRDFESHLRSQGLPTERPVVRYIANIAPEHLKSQLDLAEDYDVTFHDYDWSLNRSE